MLIPLKDYAKLNNGSYSTLRSLKKRGQLPGAVMFNGLWCIEESTPWPSRIKDGERNGDSKTRLYNTWAMMRQRCNNPNATRYNRYGGRGIKVCEEWQHDFKAFKKWALSHGYTDDLTIDRIDPDKDYCPENCQWVTMSENVKRMLDHRRRVASVSQEQTFQEFRELLKDRDLWKFTVLQREL